jgi:hypothetical protein
MPGYIYSVCSSSAACYNLVADNGTPYCSLFIPDSLVTRTDYMSHVYMPNVHMRVKKRACS